MRFPNVTHAKYGADWAGSVFERVYLEEFFTHLERHLGDGFRSTRFLILHHNTRWKPAPPIPGNNRDAILIWLADEAGHVPREWAGDFKLIFKAYWPLAGPVGNIHPFPLGIGDAVAAREPLPFAERDIPVSFSGNLNANRVDFYRSMTWLRWFPPWRLRRYFWRRLYWPMLQRWTKRRDFSHLFPAGSHVAFTGGFSKGLPADEYAAVLARTRIAICPMGFLSVECFRHFEAMKMGCVIVSPPLPPNPFYAGSPLVILDSWHSLHRVIRDLLADPNALAHTARATAQWWANVCSPRAMGESVARIVNGHII